LHVPLVIAPVGRRIRDDVRPPASLARDGRRKLIVACRTADHVLTFETVMTATEAVLSVDGTLPLDMPYHVVAAPVAH
jgi:hypothetical protein